MVIATIIVLSNLAVIAVPAELDTRPETLAPLSDAGLTPYRGMKKLRQAGKLGAGRTVVVSGIGGLGSYAVQYARLLGGGATVVAFARSDEKLALAKENGAITPSTLAVRPRKRFGMPWRTLRAGVTLTRSSTAPEPKTAWRLAQRYWPERALTCVGLMGQKVVLPLLPFTNGEKSYFGSFWGNYDDLAEVLRSRARDSSSTPLPRWPSTTSTTSWRKLARGDVVGRAVLVFD